MHRLAAFFLSLMLVLSLGLGSVAHAYEGVEGGAMSAAAATALGHHDGDGDEVPADSDKGYPHHHSSCHGEHIGVPVATHAVASNANQLVAALFPAQLAPAGIGSNPDLRPPIA